MCDQSGIRMAGSHETDDNEVATTRSDLHINLRILLPSKVAGAIIGKGGANIKRLRADNKAVIAFPDSATAERILSVSANVDVVCAIIRDVIPTISQQMNRDGENDHEIRLLIEETFIGQIIGIGGNGVKDLREKSQSHVKVYTFSAPYSSERVIGMIGTLDQITKCIGILFETIRGGKVDGIPMWYDPRNAESKHVELYGGYPENNGIAEDRGSVAPFGSGRFSEPNTSSRGGSSAVGPSSYTNSRSGETTGKVMTTKITIPKGLAGAILGKGGCHVKQVQSESGTRIKLEDASPDSAERIISITGRKNEIEKAQHLIEMIIKRQS